MDANISGDMDQSRSRPIPHLVPTDPTFVDLIDSDLLPDSNFCSEVDQGNKGLNDSIDLTSDTFTRTVFSGPIDLSGLEFPTLDSNFGERNSYNTFNKVENKSIVPKKRKIPLVIVDDSRHKVGRVQNPETNWTSKCPSVFQNTSAQPNHHHNILSSNHTFTSAHFDIQLQPIDRHNGLPSGGISSDHANNICNLPTNASSPQKDSFIKPPETHVNSVQLFDTPISTSPKMVADPLLPHLNNSTPMNLAHPTPYNQLLEMFPDIDEHFLNDYCSQGIELQQIVEIILSMNNSYPLKNQDLPPLRNTGMLPEYRNLDHFSHVENHYGAPISLTAPVQLKTSSVSTNPIPLNGNSEINHSVSSSSDIHKDIVRSAPVLSSNTISEQDNRLHSVLPSEGPSLPVVNEGNKIDEEYDEQYNFLLGLFPDADPMFLETKSKLEGDKLRMFITETLENQNYPKVTNPVTEEKQKTEENFEQFTSAFNIEKFLELFPDPVQHFTNNARVCIDYGPHAYDFLKRRYKFHSMKFIMTTYRQLNYNLVKTCELLDKAETTRSTKRSKQELECLQASKSLQQQLEFLQEVCFIEHAAEIKTYVDKTVEEKRLAYEQAEKRGELIECGCCYSNIMFEECATCTEGDLFCKSCIRRSSEIRVSEGFTTFPCLLDCGASFSLQLLQSLLGAKMFSKLVQRIQIDEVRAADIEGLEVCPFCEFATIPPPETSIFTCLNPDCSKESCRKCHKISHIPQRCEEVENDDQARARKYIEDEMTKALVRECYKCKKSFIKSDGCNKMTCTCGARMCYICRQPVQDYKHFNGPNGSEKQKCPLYSTDKVLHVDAVNVVAKKALETVSATNPEMKLKHDPTKILPKTPTTANKPLPAGVEEVPEVLLEYIYQHWGRLQPPFVNPPQLLRPRTPPPVVQRHDRIDTPHPAAGQHNQIDVNVAPDGRAHIGGDAVVVLHDAVPPAHTQ